MQLALRISWSIALVLVASRTVLAIEPRDAAGRAAAFLAVEVPRWQRVNRCYSCHNNGDAFRALVRANQAGLIKDRTPLGDTLAFLAAPDRWDANGPDGPFKDLQLARIQFAAALTEAAAAKLVDGRRVLVNAAGLVAELQQEDGSWPSDAPGTVGSPVTYGPALATAMAIGSLRAAGRPQDAPRIQRGVAWFLNRDSQSVLDASATLIALAHEKSARAGERRAQAIELLHTGQSDDGGWGPFVRSPPEVFDTALAVIALSRQSDRKALEPLIAAGRKYLIGKQLPDGSWPPTTRPAGADSYAQQLSTTGWALQALLP